MVAATGRRCRRKYDPYKWSVSIPARRSKVLCLGMSYPSARQQINLELGSKVNLLHVDESVEQAIELVRRNVLTEMDGRDLARCLALEAPNDTHAYTVSMESGAVYSGRHLNANFNRKSFLQELKHKWGNDVKFRQIILDYFWIPRGSWVMTHWNRAFFAETLPSFVQQGLLDFEHYEANSDKHRKFQYSKIENNANTDIFDKVHPSGVGGAVIYLPFCLHCVKHIVGAIGILSKYYTVSFLLRSELAQHALWAATSTIDPDSMQNWLGKAIDQENIYCTFSYNEVISSADDAHVRKDQVLEVLHRINHFRDIRMIKLTALKMYDPHYNKTLDYNNPNSQFHNHEYYHNNISKKQNKGFAKHFVSSNDPKVGITVGGFLGLQFDKKLVINGLDTTKTTFQSKSNKTQYHPIGQVQRSSSSSFSYCTKFMDISSDSDSLFSHEHSCTKPETRHNKKRSRNQDASHDPSTATKVSAKKKKKSKYIARSIGHNFNANKINVCVAGSKLYSISLRESGNHQEKSYTNPLHKEESRTNGPNKKECQINSLHKEEFMHQGQSQTEFLCYQPQTMKQDEDNNKNKSMMAYPPLTKSWNYNYPVIFSSTANNFVDMVSHSNNSDKLDIKQPLQDADSSFTSEQIIPNPRNPFSNNFNNNLLAKIESCLYSFSNNFNLIDFNSKLLNNIKSVCTDPNIVSSCDSFQCHLGNFSIGAAMALQTGNSTINFYYLTQVDSSYTSSSTDLVPPKCTLEYLVMSMVNKSSSQTKPTPCIKQHATISPYPPTSFNNFLGNIIIHHSVETFFDWEACLKATRNSLLQSNILIFRLESTSCLQPSLNFKICTSRDATNYNAEMRNCLQCFHISGNRCIDHKKKFNFKSDNKFILNAENESKCLFTILSANSIWNKIKLSPMRQQNDDVRDRYFYMTLGNNHDSTTKSQVDKISPYRAALIPLCSLQSLEKCKSMIKV